ncbi:accessory gene regulator B family protein [Jutongia sp.]|uniref:accessory gene regulator B family protein n=1 Tax=Jutongia sp. TaxID=2944204 RepID=UPI003080D459
MEKLAKRIVDRLIIKGYVVEKQRNIYEYGVRQMIMYFGDLVGILIIGMYENAVWETLGIAVLFMLLQRYAGSYHAPVRWLCYVGSMVMIIASVEGYLTLLDQEINIWFLFILAGGIVFLSPVENKNKPLDEKGKKVYKRKCIQICVIYIIISVASKILSINEVINMIVIIFIDVILLQIAGKIIRYTPNK